MPDYYWIDESGHQDEWYAPTIDEAVEDIYAETGEYPVYIWEQGPYPDYYDEDDYPEFYDEDWSYGGTDD